MSAPMPTMQEIEITEGATKAARSLGEQVSIPWQLAEKLCAAARRGVEADARLCDWEELFAAAINSDIPAFLKVGGSIKELWPNDWHQDCAALAFYIKGLRAALAEAVRREREACACVCFDRASQWLTKEGVKADGTGIAQAEALCCAEAIRARNDQRGPAARSYPDGTPENATQVQSGPHPQGESDER